MADETVEQTTYECGGCGAASQEAFPACVSGKAPHREPPAKGFPTPDWLTANTDHPPHAAYAAKYGPKR